MARIKSAIKKNKQIEKRTLQNKSVKSSVSTAMKKFKTAVNANNVEEADKLLSAAFKAIDSACSGGIIHKNNAARKKAGLAKLLNDLKTGKLLIAAKVDSKTKMAEKRAKMAEERAAIIKANTEAREKRAADKVEAEKNAKKKPAKKVEEKPAEKAPAKPKAAKAKKTDAE